MPGFTKLDNDLLRVILTSDFTKRQLKILLLIIRFSYGYQKRYAVLKKRDFSAAGVSPFCIKEELEKLSKLKVICHEGAHDVFWINEEISQWDVETFGDNLRRMARISVKNSLKRQMSIYQNAIVDVAKTTTANNKERERYSNNWTLDKMSTVDERFTDQGCQKPLAIGLDSNRKSRQGTHGEIIRCLS